MKSSALSLEDVYQRDHCTVLVGLSIMNSAASDAFLDSAGGDLVRNSFRIFPSRSLMSIEGILIPAPVPSSDMMISFTSYPELSMMTAKLPPAFSIFLTLVTNEHSPLSTKNIGVSSLSGSPVKSFVKLLL